MMEDARNSYASSGLMWITIKMTL